MEMLNQAVLSAVLDTLLLKFQRPSRGVSVLPLPNSSYTNQQKQNHL